jgi:hypothetical protein
VACRADREVRAALKFLHFLPLALFRRFAISPKLASAFRDRMARDAAMGRRDGPLLKTMKYRRSTMDQASDPGVASRR